MTTEEIKTKLIAAGIRNLKEYGYPSVTEENILTDDIYSQMFLSMLSDNKGNGKAIDTAIEQLETTIKTNSK